jgi:hypothetical protein
LQGDADELAGLQRVVGIGDLGAHLVTAGLRIDARVGEVDPAAARKGRSVGEFDRDLKGVVARQRQAAFGHRLVEAQLLVVRDVEQDPDRVDLRDGGEQRRVGVGEAAFG